MSEVYLTNLSKQTLEWKKSAYRPAAKDWPDSIYLEDKVLKELKYLEDYTKEKSFSGRKMGSTGWEYSETVVYLGGELFFSKPKTGDYNSVVPELRISKPVLRADKDSIEVRFSIGDKQVSSNIKRNVLERDNAFGPVFIVHTHPKSRVSESKEIYTFFSSADLRFLHQSPIYMLGMVSKNTLWLVCETNKFNSIDTALLHGATVAEYEGGDEAIKTYIAENLESTGLIFYHGTFGSKLRRVQFEKYQYSKNYVNSSEPRKTFSHSQKEEVRRDELNLGSLKAVRTKKRNLQTAFIVVASILMIATMVIFLKIVGFL